MGCWPRPRRASSPGSSDMRSGRWSRPTTATTPARASSTRHRRWSPTDAGQDPGLVRQRVGLRQPPGRAGPQGRREPRRRLMAAAATAAKRGDLRNYILVTGGVLDRHPGRRGDPDARPLLLLRARLYPVRGRLAVPLLRGLRDRHQPRRRVPCRPVRTQGDPVRRAGDPDRRAADARRRPRLVAGRALRDGRPGPLWDRQGPDQDELQERGEARRAGGLRISALQMGGDPHRVEERAQGCRVLPRVACCSP